MATQIDERVVSMKFDNARFEEKSRATLKTLEKLHEQSTFEGAGKGLEELGKAASRVNLSNLEESASAVEMKFSAMSVVAITSLQRITNAAIDSGKRIAKALTIDPISTGFNEYELKMGSIQTIMASTGESIETVSGYLNELNEYSDRTIYSFSDMTQNIGKFTNAGVKLDKAVAAIKGVSNVAAVSGANANEASRAMYNFAQALSAGYVKLIDWKSIENANMATVEFKDQLLETALALGTVTKSSDGMYKTLKGNSFNATRNFNEVLTDQWLTTDVLVQTLEKYADETTKIGKKAYASAQDIKTFTMLLDTLKEAAQSGWAMSYELIIGNFEEAKALWSSVNKVVSGIIEDSANERNKMLQEWKELGGRDSAIEAVAASWEALMSIIQPFHRALRDLFPPMTGQRLYELTNTVKEFAKGLKLSEEASYTLQVALKTLLLPVKIVVNLLKVGIAIAAGLTQQLGKLLDKILAFPSKTKEIGEALEESVGDSKYLRAAEALLKIVQKFKDSFSLLGKTISSAFNFDPNNGILGFFKDISKITFEGFVSGLEMLASIDIVGIFKSILSVFDSFNIQKALGFVFAGGTLAFQKSITDFIRSVTGATKSIGGIGSSFKGILSNFSDSITAFSTKTKTEGLLKIAGSVGILTASLVVLSSINTEKLISSVAIISLLFGQLTMISSKLEGGSDFSKKSNLVVLAGFLVGFASSMLILSGAVKTLASVNMDEMIVSVLGIEVLIMTMSKTITKLSESNAKAIKGAMGLIAFSIAIRLLASSVKTLSNISFIDLTKGLGSVVALCITLSSVITKGDFKGFGISSGFGLIEMATSLLVLSSAVEKFGELSLLEIGKGLLSISSALGIMTIAINNIPKGAATKAIGLVLLSTALSGIGRILKDVGSLGWDQIARGLVALAGSLIILCSSINATKTALPGAAALAVVSASLLTLIPVLKTLGGMSLAEIGIAFVGLAGSLAILGGAAVLLGPLVPSLLAISGAIALFGVGIGAIGGGILALSAGLAGLATSGAVGVAALGEMITSIIGFGPQISAAVAEGFVLILSSLASSGATLVESFSMLFLTILETINAVSPQFVQTIGNLILLLLTTLVTYAPQFVDAASDLIVAFLKGLGRNSYRIVDAGVSMIIDLLKGIASQADSIAKAGFDVVIKLIDAMIKSVEDYTPELVGKIVELGGAIINGLIKGLFAGINSVKDSIVKIGETILSSVRSFFGIHSPSTLMRDEVGRYIVMGIAEGIKSDMSAEEAATQKAQNIVNAFKTELDKLSLDLTTFDLENQLWSSLNPNATESQQAKQQLQLLDKQLDAQGKRVELANAEYQATLKALGSQSEKTQEAYNKYMQEQITFNTYAQNMIQTQSQTAQNTASSMAAYAQLVTQDQEQLLKMGFTLDQIKSYAREKTGYMMESATDTVAQKFSSIQDVISHYIGDVEVVVQQSAAKSIGSGVQKGVQQVASQGNANGQTIVDAVAKGVENSDGSSVTQALSNKFEGSFTNFIDGLVGGASDNADKLGKTGAQIAYDTIKGFDLASIINSPSKAMYERGVYLVQGLVNGIQANSHFAADAMANLAGMSANQYTGASGGILNGLNTGLANSELSTTTNVEAFLQSIITSINNEQPLFYDSGKKLSQNLAQGIEDGFTTYFDQVSELLIAQLTELERQVQMKADSMLSLVQRILGGAASVGVGSGSITPVYSSGEVFTDLVMSGGTKRPSKPGIRTTNPISTTANLAKSVLEVVTNPSPLNIAKLAGATVQNTYSFVQNNTSPKALSRTDIYRDTKNQFSAFKKAVSSK